MTRRRSVRQPAWLLLIVACIRLILDGLDAVLRSLVWILIHICWSLEAGIHYLSFEKLPEVMQPVKIQAARRPVPVDETDEVAQMMKKLGTKDRAFAESLLAKGERIKL